MFPLLITAGCAAAFFRLRQMIRTCVQRRSFYEWLVSLSIRILGDKLPDEQVDAIYPFSQTSDNDLGQIETLLSLSKRYPFAQILVCGEDGSRNCGWEGYSKFTEKLIRASISHQRIKVVPFPDQEQTINTLNEAQALQEYCNSQLIKRLVIVSPPFHQVRCVTTLMSCFLSQKRFDGSLSTPLLYSSPATASCWTQHATHSQGNIVGSRSSFIFTEMERMWRYHKKGDLLDPKAIFTALDKQDVGV